MPFEVKVVQNICQQIVCLNRKGREKMRDLDVDGRKILKWILKESNECGVDSSGWE
jgi:hypothetical protein